jgi:CNT family concentrative nucleoside transporter
MGIDVAACYEKDPSLFEAIISGANSGMRLVCGIVALLLAVLGLVALANGLIGFVGGYVNTWFGWQGTWSIEGALGAVFIPFVLAIGVPPADAVEVARLVGARAILTEVPSYQALAGLLESGALAHPRSAVLATYALCGFAHVASLAIFAGGVTAIAPSRAGDVSRVGPRALLAATLACLMTAAVAGVFFSADAARILAPIP